MEISHFYTFCEGIQIFRFKPEGYPPLKEDPLKGRPRKKHLSC